MGSAKHVTINGTRFGGASPVRVESMLKTPLSDLDGCAAELAELKNAGCELVRIAFPDESSRANLKHLIGISKIPIMADIHFNHKFAIAALDCGAASIRINPGNMTGAAGLSSVLSAARANGAVIRIGANGGSLNNKQLSSGGGKASSLVAAVEEQLKPLAEAGFDDVIISAKSSSVNDTVRANFILAGRYPYPLHIGITEAGGGMDGAVKSAVGLGILLAQGIGDTMRVSLTGDSKTEVEVAYTILRSLELRNRGVNMISCPCCGRRRVDVAELVGRVKAVMPDPAPDGLTVAVMGCEVNGPREAASADIGIAGTEGGFVLFERGAAVLSGKLGDLEELLARRLREFLNK
ncbi:MAG: (E)-4-hydroxy-3-methylbut-2-enyl-diphosphate synthase [Synergistaceae bacterium]|jgi:(E)-4-hydroxy-3-methylbut-2-enyl-diphosphate synthase|nr:(E)-4-hydroxy-3-methylbut-2-enyl-diphosphate synthase [Synergistaceae bacterium]